jgi:hypothetical protein
VPCGSTGSCRALLLFLKDFFFSFSVLGKTESRPFRFCSSPFGHKLAHVYVSVHSFFLRAMYNGDCPIFYVRNVVKKDLGDAQMLLESFEKNICCD